MSRVVELLEDIGMSPDSLDECREDLREDQLHFLKCTNCRAILELMARPEEVPSESPDYDTGTFRTRMVMDLLKAGFSDAFVKVIFSAMRFLRTAVRLQEVAHRLEFNLDHIVAESDGWDGEAGLRLAGFAQMASPGAPVVTGPGNASRGDLTPKVKQTRFGGLPPGMLEAMPPHIRALFDMLNSGDPDEGGAGGSASFLKEMLGGGGQSDEDLVAGGPTKEPEIPNLPMMPTPDRPSSN